MHCAIMLQNNLQLANNQRDNFYRIIFFESISLPEKETTVLLFPQQQTSVSFKVNFISSKAYSVSV